MTISPLLNAQSLWKLREHFPQQSDRYKDLVSIRYRQRDLTLAIQCLPPWLRRADNWNNRGEITRKGREHRAMLAVILLAPMCQQSKKERANTVASRIILDQ